ncbi:LOW QUALITY PROTEIN: hypothetical protein PHMEG_0004799 [Phytophthora megakarya]|uniref:Eukaryotic/viral aspartic protease n=1 Tax=Phytophthora megakarya TaxID=4795 RepID=A0A225WUJ6_9STRA|nr:LOW QUALITY PROTEIN: hypothetical protein PHMEG_0004799 [Phytophthora megakarya]
MERISADRHEADLDQDPYLEEKPRIPLKAATVAIADLDENLDLLTTDKETTKSKSNMSTKSVVTTRSSKKKKIKTARTKLKARDSESEDVNKPRSTIAKDMIEQAYHRKILSEPLLQDPVLAIIQVRQIGDLICPISKPNTSTYRLNEVKFLLDILQEAGLRENRSGFPVRDGTGGDPSGDSRSYESLKILVGEHVQMPDLNYQTGSSYYASATSEPDSDSPRVPQRMSLGPSGAKYLSSRVSRPDQRPAGPSQQQAGRILPDGDESNPEGTKSGDGATDTPRNAENMESVGMESDSWEYDPDDLGIPSSSGHNTGRAAVASAAIGSGGSSLIQRVRISSISDLKQFTGQDMDEDRRGQATEDEKCLVVDLMVGPPNRHCNLAQRPLSRTTKTKWADLLESFQTQYCGLGMSVAWQYYHARKRSEETPLNYLYRLNAAILRAKLKIKDGNPKATSIITSRRWAIPNCQTA